MDEIMGEFDTCSAETPYLLVEPFYGGSHKQLLDILQREIPGCVSYTLPAKKWHWRARTSAVYLSDTIKHNPHYRVLFCSSVLNLCELVGLRPDLAKLHKILYFHENQLIYPVRKQQDRDFQYGYNQILSSLVADVVVFNSQYNMDSFLTSIKTYMKLIPDHRPSDLQAKIRPKCKVLYFPIDFPNLVDLNSIIGKDTKLEDDGELKAQQSVPNGPESEMETLEASSKIKSEFESGGVASSGQQGQLQCGLMPDSQMLHIVWPHRWEHDKDPDLFFKTLFQLKDEGLDFRLSVLGEMFTDVPEVFGRAHEKLECNILHWGYVTTKTDYYKVLQSADVVISTAKHEFFGVAMLEAVHCGCYPLCPKDLVYPEIFKDEFLYNTPNQLLKRLRQFIRRPSLVRDKKIKIDTSQYSWDNLGPMYKDILTSP